MNKRSASPENLSHFRPKRGGSDRSFGLVLAAALAILAAWPLLRGDAPRWWAAAAAAPFALLAFFLPAALAPLNRAWTALGFAMGAVVSPLVMAILFFLVFTPIGLFLRLTGKDLLSLRLDRKKPSYWVKVDAGGDWRRDMKRQY